MPKGKELTAAEKEAKLAAKRADFKRLAAKRIPNAVKAIQGVANLASYNPSDAQKEWVMKQLSDAAAQVNAAFQGKTTVETVAIPD